MNTILCDAKTSEMADTIAPLILLYVQRRLRWKNARYDNRVVTRHGMRWCLSELVPMWQQGMGEPGFEAQVRFHRDCPWQQD